MHEGSVTIKVIKLAHTCPHHLPLHPKQARFVTWLTLIPGGSLEKLCGKLRCANCAVRKVVGVSLFRYFAPKKIKRL